jgi:hypothetical protein
MQRGKLEEKILEEICRPSSPAGLGLRALGFVCHSGSGMLAFQRSAIWTHGYKANHCRDSSTFRNISVDIDRPCLIRTNIFVS